MCVSVWVCVWGVGALPVASVCSLVPSLLVTLHETNVFLPSFLSREDSITTVLPSGMGLRTRQYGKLDNKRSKWCTVRMSLCVNIVFNYYYYFDMCYTERNRQSRKCLLAFARPKKVNWLTLWHRCCIFNFHNELSMWHHSVHLHYTDSEQRETFMASSRLPE